MSTNKDNNQRILDDVHPFLEKVLIGTHLKGKGYALEDLKYLPKATARQFLTEASSCASGKLAEVEVKARLMQDPNDACVGE